MPSFINSVETAISYLKQPSKRKLIGFAKSLAGKTGLEIGGPSNFFGLRGYCPLYLYAAVVDGVNFSTDTVWEGHINEGNNYKYFQNKIGYQFIGEASNLSFVGSDKYDFVASCHSLEHVANPLKALLEWKRVLKKNGFIVLVIPDKEKTFDRMRPITTIQHMIDDFRNKIDEKDATHFEETIALHDFALDDIVKDKKVFEERVRENFKNRCVHHHVFNLSVIEEMMNWCDFEVVHQQKGDPFHLITIAKKK